jgi:transposase
METAGIWAVRSGISCGVRLRRHLVSPQFFDYVEDVRAFADFAELLAPAAGNDVRLTDWITAVRAGDLPHLQGFCNGLELDRTGVDAVLTPPYHHGRTEGVNTRTKKIMRQMHGRAGFGLLHHRILLP